MESIGLCFGVVRRLLRATEDDDPERPRAVYAALQSEYARLAGLSPASLTAAIEFIEAGLALG